MAIKQGGDIATITIPKILDSTSAGNYDGVQYKLKDVTARSLSLEYINGTQDISTTNWEGQTSKSEAFDGMLIAYRLPYDSATSSDIDGTPPLLTLTLGGDDLSPHGTFSSHVLLAESLIDSSESSSSESGLIVAGTLITLAYDVAPSGYYYYVNINPVWDGTTYYYLNNDVYVATTSEVQGVTSYYKRVSSVWRSAAVGTDSRLSSESVLPVQNKVITNEINSINSSISDVDTLVKSVQSTIYGPDGTGTQSGILFDISTNSASIDALENTATAIQTQVNAIPGQINDAITNFYNDNIWVWKDENDSVVKGYKEEITAVQDIQTRNSWDILLNNSPELGVDLNGTHSNNLTVSTTLKLGNYTLQINDDGSWEMS